MRWCASCVLPDTRPNLVIGDDGVCNACRTHGQREGIDWKARRRDLDEVVGRAQARSHGWDCLLPVSGGKDSTWQTVVCLELGLNPLAVTWKTPARTELGQRNLDNLVALGVDHVDFQVNPRVERKFMLAALERFGSTAIPMHMALFNIPLTAAVRYGIPLVVWGENAAAEYGGAEGAGRGHRLDREWLRRFGVMHGTTAVDWVSDRLTAKELTPYFGPTDDELERADVEAVFLGHYLGWDPERSLEIASAHGFRSAGASRTGYYDYADLDDDFISIHHWLKWPKFGFTRTFDNLSLEIRNGRLTRDEAIEILREHGDETPHEDIERFCEFAGITRMRFDEIVERWRNPDVWTRRNGRWEIDGFLVPDWRWT